MKSVGLALVLTLGGLAAACGDNVGVGVEVPERPTYREWTKVEPEGAVCGNNSQYKFFVNFSDVSNNLVIAFEPGGACWDYESCTGQSGIRGAANIDGISDRHMDDRQFYVPFFNRDEEGDSPTPDWNYVFVPYCTGDVHTGDNVITYSDPNGVEPDVEFHHAGHDNVQKVIEWLGENFENVPDMLVTGCSAGGVGSLINYYYLRKGMPGVEHSYLLSDSGPIFPTPGFSKPLHEQVYASWNVQSLLADLPDSFEEDNFGSINTTLADEFPDDRLTVTYFRRDYNYTLYSYERFYDYPPKEEIMDMWWADTQQLMELYDTRDNLAYYIPYWRALNSSHCSTLITFRGAEIQEADATLRGYVDDLLFTDAPLESLVESVQPGEDAED